MEVAMQDSPNGIFDPGQLAVLSGVLVEVLAQAKPPDESAIRSLSERLGRLLLQQLGDGITDRATLKAAPLKAISSD
jgi:hypothetical protein